LLQPFWRVALAIWAKRTVASSKRELRVDDARHHGRTEQVTGEGLLRADAGLLRNQEAAMFPLMDGTATHQHDSEFGALR